MLIYLKKVVVTILLVTTSYLTANVYYPNLFKDQFDANWITPHDPFIIHTIPKCGVHQLQRLIQLLVPEDIVIASCLNVASENFYQNHLVMRTHESYSVQALEITKQSFYKMVAIIRDPRDALISHLHYMRLFGEQNPAPLKRDFFNVGADFDSFSIDKQITTLILGDQTTQSYLVYYKKRLGFALSRYAYAVKYEHLQPDKDNIQLTTTIKKIAAYLGIRLKPDHLEFILNNIYNNQVPYAGVAAPKDGLDLMGGKKYKRAATGNWQLFLNSQHKILLKALIGHELIALGYEKDLNW